MNQVIKYSSHGVTASFNNYLRTLVNYTAINSVPSN